MPRPRKRGQQIELDFAEFTADKIRPNDFVNQVRDRVDIWRKQRYPHVTPTTRRLLEHWSDPERDNPILFAQREAAETAIYLAEAAQKAGDAWIRNELNETNAACNLGLHRVALKMATGSGKTVVMAMLIAWQTLNKVAQPNDARFAKRFLVITPGLTIRDRLRVLLPEDEQNYYKLRGLVPADLHDDLGQAKIVIANYHQLQRRETKQGKTVGSLTKELLAGTAGAATPFRESWGQMVARVCRDLGGTSGIVVFNDEAHHCYLDRYDNPEDEGITDKDLIGDDKAEAQQNTEAARLWFNGLRAINERLGVKAVYDLSATPSFLSGSGYREGTLFPWVVSDFGLVEAIESGIVKIPRVPVDDNATTPDVRFLNLWPGIKDGLPKKGRNEGTVTPDQMPGLLEAALNALYDSYAKAFAAWGNSDAKKYGEPAPVFIVVCNNTTISKMVYDYIAGWEKPLSDLPGRLGAPASSRCSPTSITASRSRAAHNPRRLSQFESGEGLSPEFKKIAATEIEEFRDSPPHPRPEGAEDVDDGQIMREVMNTVGKAGKLGEPVRCVVSVSMLTEGWDANTVTHILGVRAFGTQLPVRAGRWPRPAPPLLRAGRNGLLLHPRVRRRVRRPVPVHAHRRQGREPALLQADPLRPRPAGEEKGRDQLSAGGRLSRFRLEIRDPELSRTSRTVPADSGHERHPDRGERPHRRVRGPHARRPAGQARPGGRLRARAPDHDLVRRRPRLAPVVLPAGATDHQAVDGRVRHPPRRHVPRALPLLAETADEAARRILHESIAWSGDRSRRQLAEVVPLFQQGDRTGSTADVDFITTKRSTRPGRNAT